MAVKKQPRSLTGSLDAELLKLALEHGRAWVALHADHRLRAVNFFLIAAAFLTTAFVTSVDRDARLAAAAASAGIVMTLGFSRMESRTRSLVKLGEAALKPLEVRLAQALGVEALKLVTIAERAAWFTSYAKVIAFLHLTALFGFAAALLFALLRLNPG